MVEISPLGLVEMTRQNVTDGPREILAKKCPVCAGDGIVVSEQTAAVELEQRLRTLVKGSRSKVFRVEVNAHVASVLIGPGARRACARSRRSRSAASWSRARRRARTTTSRCSRRARPTAEPEPAGRRGRRRQPEARRDRPVRRPRWRRQAGRPRGRRRGRREAVGKKVTARLERVMNGVAWATLARPRRASTIRSPPRARPSGRRARGADAGEGRGGRRRSSRTRWPPSKTEVIAEEVVDEEPVGSEPAPETVVDGEQPAEGTTPKKKTRRGHARRPQPAQEAGGQRERRRAGGRGGRGSRRR